MLHGKKSYDTTASKEKGFCAGNDSCIESFSETINFFGLISIFYFLNFSFVASFIENISNPNNYCIKYFNFILKNAKWV